MNSLLSHDYLKSFSIVDFGITDAAKPLSFENYQEWIKQGGNGSLSYLEGHRLDLRSSLTNFFPEFQSALVFLFSYQETESCP